ncbi:hypothetical protein CDL15_Pgr005185 [Punica granatum]|uniref:Uncharacterized protein n=1 Tax=Punica granatum TaxID=22663 RepID=A0A218WP68_PUNGR|nr:hypothetical protein CDL15_Pgr005185 [Punica granatum]
MGTLTSTSQNSIPASLEGGSSEEGREDNVMSHSRKTRLQITPTLTHSNKQGSDKRAMLQAIRHLPLGLGALYVKKVADDIRDRDSCDHEG